MPIRPIIARDFAGLNILDQPQDMRINESRLAENCYIESGRVKSRPFKSVLLGETFTSFKNDNGLSFTGDVVSTFWADNISGNEGLLILDSLGQFWFFVYNPDSKRYVNFTDVSVGVDGTGPLKTLNGPTTGQTVLFPGVGHSQIRYLQWKNSVIVYKVGGGSIDNFFVIQDEGILRLSPLVQDPSSFPDPVASTSGSIDYLGYTGGTAQYIIVYRDDKTGIAFTKTIDVTITGPSRIDMNIMVPLSWATSAVDVNIEVYRRDTITDGTSDAYARRIFGPSDWKTGSLGITEDTQDGSIGTGILQGNPPGHFGIRTLGVGAPAPLTYGWIGFQDRTDTNDRDQVGYFDAEIDLDSFDPTCAFIYQNRVIWGRSNGAVTISKLSQPFTTSDDNYELFLVQETSSIYHGQTIQETGVIFTSQGIYHLVGNVADQKFDGSYEFIHMWPGIRFVSQQYTVVDESNNLYAWAEDGFYKYDLRQPMILSGRIRPVVFNLSENQFSNVEVFLEPLRKLIFTRFNLSGVVYVYHYSRQGVIDNAFRVGDWTTWELDTFVTMNIARPFIDEGLDTPESVDDLTEVVNENNKFLMISTASEFWHLFQTSAQANGETSFDVNWKTKLFDGGSPHRYKRWTDCYFASNQSFDIIWYYWDETSDAPLILNQRYPIRSDALQGNNFRQIIRVRPKIKSVGLQFTISYDNITSEVQLKSFEVNANVIGR